MIGRSIRLTFYLDPNDRARAYTRAPVIRRKPTAIASVLDLLHQIPGRAFIKVEIALMAAREPHPQSLCHVCTLDPPNAIASPDESNAVGIRPAASHRFLFFLGSAFWMIESLEGKKTLSWSSAQ
jgi:hypothetical protein